MKTLQKISLAITGILFVSAQAHATMFLARAYDPNLQRWLTRDPIGELPGTISLTLDSPVVAELRVGEFARRDPILRVASPQGGVGTSDYGEQVNLYRFVRNDPINWIDLFGLSPHDVNKILKSAKSYIKKLTESGLRTGNGALGASWNNITAWFGKRLGCAEQTDLTVANALLPLDFDDNWTFAHVRTAVPLFHQFVIAHSDNPLDPTILIDPNHDEITILHGPTATSRVLIGADIYRKSSVGTITASEVTFGGAVGFFLGSPPANQEIHHVTPK